MVSLKPTFTTGILAFALTSSVTGQFSLNGQVYSSGLAIINAPNPRSPYHAGSNIPISVDVSGNGKLQGKDKTSIDTLDIYLVSLTMKTNMTVSSGGSLLEGEPGSTVKHLDFQIASCVAPGDYNMTWYESSTVEGVKYYSITDLPISIQNADKGATACQTGLNEVDKALPQLSSPPKTNPWLAGTSATPSPVWDGTVLPTVTPNSDGHNTASPALGLALFVGMALVSGSVF